MTERQQEHTHDIERRDMKIEERDMDLAEEALKSDVEVVPRGQRFSFWLILATIAVIGLAVWRPTTASLIGAGLATAFTTITTVFVPQLSRIIAERKHSAKQVPAPPGSQEG